MFQSPYQDIYYRQQPITLNQCYPCPRCREGLLETHGHTETLKCGHCERTFVPLRCGKRLYPAKRLGRKIAPTYWWDGLRWHWAGTTATSTQMIMILLAFILPVVLTNMSFSAHLWNNSPDWLNPMLVTAVIGLLTIKTIYFVCWDFDFATKKKSSHQG